MIIKAYLINRYLFLFGKFSKFIKSQKIKTMIYCGRAFW